MMRIHVWQGFSSNHSARFTVVGVFKTPAEAEAAAERVRALIRDISAWRVEGQVDADGYAVNSGDEPPTPPEAALAEALDIDWGDFAVDWAWEGTPEYSPVRTLERVLFIDGTESEQGAHPADELVRKLGGTALVDGVLTADEWGPGEHAEVQLALTCTAPDEATAQAIETAVAAYLQPVYETNPITGTRYVTPSFETPWKDYAGPMGRSAFAGQVRRERARLTFETGTFFHIADGFPAMLAYLRDKGCTEIEYQFVEEREGDEE